MENVSFVNLGYYEIGSVVSLIAMVLMVATSFIGAQVIPSPSRVPLQFGVNGKPTWFGSRGLALCFMPIAGIVCIVGLWVMTRDGSGTRLNHEAIIFIVRSLVAGVWVGVHALHLLFAARFLARQSVSSTH